MRGWLQDLHYSLRSFRRRPLLITSIVVMLAVGIGCNSAIFAFVDRLLIRPLPFPESRRLVTLWEVERKKPDEPSPASMSNAVDWMQKSSSFESLGVYMPWMPSLVGEGEPERLVGISASSGYFRALKTKPFLGRTFTAEEDRPAESNVVILSHSLWRRRFGADPAVLGRTVRIGGQPCTVIGVLNDDFRHPNPEYYDKVDVWSPLSLDAQPGDRGGRYLYTIARLKPGVGVERAQSEMGQLARDLTRQYPESNAGWGITVRPLRDEFLGGLKHGLLLLSLAAGLLLIVACVNVANLLLARTLEREQDLRIRAALGANRSFLARQPLVESLVLTVFVGGVALLLALSEIHLFRALIPDPLPTGEQIGLNLRSVGFTLLISLLATLVCGALPALRAASHTDKVVRSTGSVLPEGRRGALLNSSLGAVEIALTLPLLIGGVLLYKSFHNMTQVDLGFQPQKLAMFELSAGRSKYPSDEAVGSFYRQVVSRLAALPGVEAVSLVNNAPFTIWNTSNFFTPQGWVATATERPDAEYRVVSPNYFHTLRIRTLRGRSFDRTDQAGSPGVVIVNRELAERYWPGQDPIGKRLTLEDPGAGNWLSVVGLAENVRGSGVRADPRPMIYRVFDQTPTRFMTVVVRTGLDLGSLATPVRRAVWDVDKDMPVANFQSMEGNVADALAAERSRTALLGLFALTAVVLTGFGIYTLLTHAVNKRRREFGLRVAMGATRGDIVRAAMFRGVKVTLAGMVAGLFLAVSLAGVLRATLYQVRPFDLMVFLTGILLQSAVALLAIYLPSQRAARVDPANVLRTL